MKRTLPFILALLLFALALAAVLLAPARPATAFSVVGDIENPVTIDSFTGLKTGLSFRNGGLCRSTDISEIINTAAPKTEEYSLVMVGDDGLTAESESVSDIIISYSKEFGWQCIAGSHPRPMNIKNLREIWVCAKNAPEDYGVFSVTSGDKTESFTMGQLLRMQRVSRRLFEGSAEKNGRGVTVYTTHTGLLFREFDKNAKTVGMFARDGMAVETSVDDGILILSGKHVGYLSDNGKTKIETVERIQFDPPSASGDSH